MNEQELRSEFFAKTGRVATSESVEYQAFLWGFTAAAASRDAEVAELVVALEHSVLYVPDLATVPGIAAVLAKVRKP